MGDRPPVKLDYARPFSAIEAPSVSTEPMAYVFAGLVMSCVPPLCIFASIMAIYKGWQVRQELRSNGRPLNGGTIVAITFAVCLLVMSLWTSYEFLRTLLK